MRRQASLGLNPLSLSLLFFSACCLPPLLCRHVPLLCLLLRHSTSQAALPGQPLDAARQAAPLANQPPLSPCRQAAASQP